MLGYYIACNAFYQLQYPFVINPPYTLTTLTLTVHEYSLVPCVILQEEKRYDNL